MGVETIEEILLLSALPHVSSEIEGTGFLAVPQRRNQTLRAKKERVNPEMLHIGGYTAGAREPQLDFLQAAGCKMGEVGQSGALLMEEFGPFQQVAFVLTDAKLPETPRAAHSLCDQCGKCASACPGHAIREQGHQSTSMRRVLQRRQQGMTIPLCRTMRMLMILIGRASWRAIRSSIISMPAKLWKKLIFTRPSSMDMCPVFVAERAAVPIMIIWKKKES